MKISTVLLTSAGALLAIFLLAPALWLVILSLSEPQLIMAKPPVVQPGSFHLTNYAALLGLGDDSSRMMVRPIANSAIVSFTVTVIAVLVALLAGWGLSRLKLPNWILGVMVATYLLPQTALVGSLYLNLSKLGLLDSITGLILVNLGPVVPFTIWLMKSTIDNVPAEIEDAARADGATRLGAFFRVVVPLIRPGLATTFLFAMLMSWDEFLYALLFTATDQSKTVTVAIGDFLSGRVANYGMIAAAGVLAGALPLMVGFYVQRHIVEGLTAGSVKG